MADVFVSYKRDERPAVERIAAELRGLGLSVWFDASMSAGEAFSDEIDREARAAKCILVCWSPQARESRWVKAEAMIGFEQDKLAAAYVAGPDGFSPPTPFNASHAEDLRAWLAASSEAHAGWKSVLRRIGKLTARADIESFGALDPQASATELRAWLAAHEASPLFMAADALLSAREAEGAARAELEREARERRARQEAERRAEEEPARAARARNRAGAGRAAAPVVALLALAVLLLAWRPWGGAQQIQIAPQPAQQTQIVLPEMVRIPAGSFTMGSPSSEAGRYNNEGPQRTVRIAEFYMSRTEVTFAQWDACVAAGGCSHRPADEGWGRGERPVINVSWNDAQDYVRWLSRETGRSYRLLTEAEWEYAARAGTTGPFSTGAMIMPSQAQYDWSNSYNGSPTSSNPGRTASVDSFPANQFGLHDMHGNVWEWVQDCYARSYSGHPINGSAYETSSCSSRVVRGGSWGSLGSGPRDLRSAVRSWNAPTVRIIDLGFRLARTV